MAFNVAKCIQSIHTIYVMDNGLLLKAVIQKLFFCGLFFICSFSYYGNISNKSKEGDVTYNFDSTSLKCF